jgi:hypothetical protein
MHLRTDFRTNDRTNHHDHYSYRDDHCSNYHDHCSYRDDHVSHPAYSPASSSGTG